MLDRVRNRICVTNWSVLPAPVWAVVASPLLRWAGIGNPSGRWLNWPRGSSTSPFARSFWYVGVSSTHGREGSLWFRRDGQPRRLKPSNFDNPVSSLVNRALFYPGRPGECRLPLWLRVLLTLGF